MALEIDQHFFPTNAAQSAATGPAHDHLVEQTQKWVAQTFYGTLLKQMRESPFRNAMFEGGRGGQVFGSMMDQRLAEHMGRSTGSKLVYGIVRKIESGRLKKNKVGYGIADHKGESSSPSTPDVQKPKHEHFHVPTNIRA